MSKMQTVLKVCIAEDVHYMFDFRPKVCLYEYLAF